MKKIRGEQKRIERQKWKKKDAEARKVQHGPRGSHNNAGHRISHTHTHTGRGRHRMRDTQTNKQTGKHTDKQTDSQ